MAKSGTASGQNQQDRKNSRSGKAPDTVAVALKYTAESADQAPLVSASGRGYLADRIIEMAQEMDIPVRSDSDLVEILAATEVGEEIPVEAFIAVAEILRYVYALNGRSIPNPPS